MSISPEMAKSMLNVLSALAQREGAQMPSTDVQRAAAAIDGGRVSVDTAPALRYHVDSPPARYMVVVTYTHAPGRRDLLRVLDVECSCKAGATGHLCKHALRVLAAEDLAGRPLDH